jgi:DNA gyrase subunit A
MRIVIELTKTADPQEILRDLYKYTPMQSTFSIIMLALVDGEPRLLSLKQALRVYLDHRMEVIRRRSEFDLEKARQRAHILEGLRIALNHLDEVIALIRRAPDADTARTRLEKRYKLTTIQAQAILDMQLRRLASLERKKIETEYQEIQKLIKSLVSLLLSPNKMRQVVGNELQAVKETFADRRRTQIATLKAGEISIPLTVSDLAPDQTVWLCVSPEGLVSRTADDKTPRQSGGDVPILLLKTNTRDTLYLACKDGNAAALPVQNVPEADKPSLGVHYAKISPLQETDKLAAIFTLPAKQERGEGWYLLTTTHQGMLKKSAITDVPGPSANSFVIVKINEGDQLGWLRLTDGQSDVLLLTARGMAIRFTEEDVRPMGLVAAGVMGIKLQKDDEVVGMEIIKPTDEILLLASDGSAKRVAVSQFPQQGRYGQGVSAWKLPSKVHAIGLATGKGTTRITLYLKELAPKMVRLDAAPLQGRTARGKVIQELKEGDQVVSITAPWEIERPIAEPAEEKRNTSSRRQSPRRSPKQDAKTTSRKSPSPSKSVAKSSRSTKNPPSERSNRSKKSTPRNTTKKTS